MTGSKPMTTEEMAVKYVLQEERKRETTRIWRLAHKDEVDAKVKVYHHLNKERVKKLIDYGGWLIRTKSAKKSSLITS